MAPEHSGSISTLASSVHFSQKFTLILLHVNLTLLNPDSKVLKGFPLSTEQTRVSLAGHMNLFGSFPTIFLHLLLSSYCTLHCNDTEEHLSVVHNDYFFYIWNVLNLSVCHEN